MRITPTGSVGRVRRGADIADGPVLTKGARRFLAERAWTVYTLSGDGWQLQHIDISGPMVKKDGTLSVAYMTRSWSTHSPDRPEWVDAIIAHTAPRGTPSFDQAGLDIEERA